MNALLVMLEQASREKPVTRERISGMFRVSDRAAREMIERLRDSGYPVIGTSDARGYWIAKNEEELQMFLRNYTAKAKTIQDRADKICQTFYQERMDV